MALIHQNLVFFQTKMTKKDESMTEANKSHTKSSKTETSTSKAALKPGVKPTLKPTGNGQLNNAKEPLDDTQQTTVCQKENEITGSPPKSKWNRLQNEKLHPGQKGKRILLLRNCASVNMLIIV